MKETKELLIDCLDKLDKLYSLVEKGWLKFESPNHIPQWVGNKEIELDVSITPLQEGCGLINDIRRNINVIKKYQDK